MEEKKISRREREREKNGDEQFRERGTSTLVNRMRKCEFDNKN